MNMCIQSVTAVNINCFIEPIRNNFELFLSLWLWPVLCNYARGYRKFLKIFLIGFPLMPPNGANSQNNKLTRLRLILLLKSFNIIIRLQAIMQSSVSTLLHGVEGLLLKRNQTNRIISPNWSRLMMAFRKFSSWIFLATCSFNMSNLFQISKNWLRDNYLMRVNYYLWFWFAK